MVENDAMTEAILKAAYEVHSVLGPGLMESTYATCLHRELADAGLAVERESPMSVVYKGLVLECAYRADLVVERRVIVEIKSVDYLQPVHSAQVLTYMKFARIPVGLLLNFNVAGCATECAASPAAPSIRVSRPRHHDFAIQSARPSHHPHTHLTTLTVRFDQRPSNEGFCLAKNAL